MELREYQKTTRSNIKDALIQGYTAPLVVSPTGSGKTISFVDIAVRTVKKGNRVLILVHRQEIMEQTLKKLFEFKVNAGQIASGKRMTADKIQVAMVGTLVNRLGSVFKPDLIIIDECHHSPANQWRKIMAYFNDVKRIGFTATPERLDGVGLGDMYDKMVMGPTVKWLVENGYLAYPRVFTGKVSTPTKYKVKMGDYDKKEQTEAMTDRVIIGDVIEHYKKMLGGLPAICFCVSIEHCKIMEDNFNQAGIKSRTIHGKMKRKEREAVIQGLATGEFSILNSCDVISEGVDIPVVAGAILLRKTRSLSLYLQQVGRPLRPYPGKKDAIILDHCGNYYLHGHPIQERDWSLYHEKRKPEKEEPPKITRCPKCLVIHPGEPPKCDVCGHNFQEKKKRDKELRIKEIEGTLTEVLPESTSEDEVKNLSNFIDRIKSMEPGKMQKALWAKAYELGNKDKIDALREAVGYNKGWTKIVWDKVKKQIKT